MTHLLALLCVLVLLASGCGRTERPAPQSDSQPQDVRSSLPPTPIAAERARMRAAQQLREDMRAAVEEYMAAVAVEEAAWSIYPPPVDRRPMLREQNERLLLEAFEAATAGYTGVLNGHRFRAGACPVCDDTQPPGHP